MEGALLKIRNLLSQSSLSKDEQDELFVVFSLLGEANLSSVADVLAGDPSLIKKIYENYKAKREVAQTKNADALRKIIEEEKDLLEKIGA